MPKKVTDPALLEKLNAGGGSAPAKAKKVTDPDLLHRLNGGDPEAVDDGDLGSLDGDAVRTLPDGRIEAVNPMAQGSPAPEPTPATTSSPAPKGEEPEWSQPAIVPLSHSRKTGEWRWTVPSVVQGGIDAVMLPGEVLSGKYNDELDPRNGMRTLSPELIGRTLGFAGTFGGGGTAFATKNAPVIRSLGAQSADEFGIPLTQGQTLGSLPQLTKEEALRQGGGAPQNIMRNFDAAQREKIVGAADNIGLGLGSNPESMTDSVVGAIQNKVGFHKEQAASLYDIAADGSVSVRPEMVDALPMIVDQSLKGASVIVDERLTPGAAVAMKLISDASEMGGALMPAAGKGAEGLPDEIKGISLEGIEQLRKQIVGLGEGANDTDARAIKAIKRSLDEWTQTAVDNMLVSGDDSALEALKAARKASGEYLKITSPDAGDVAGASVAKMAKGDATAEEVANWLYGADVAAPTLNAPKVAARVKELVGPDSPEWSAVRASAWERLTKDAASGDTRSNAMVAKRIETFLNAKGTTLSQVLYSDEERAAMQRFADALKTTVTPRDATNPSRTAWSLTGAINNVTRLLTGLTVGTATQNPMIGAGAALSIPVFKGIGARKAAVEATRQGAGRTLGPVTTGATLGATRGTTNYIGDTGANDNGLAPSVRKPSSTMSLNDWVKQKEAAGQLAV